MQFVIFHMIMGLILFVPLGFIAGYIQYKSNNPKIKK
jgi:hypothetical protein